MEDPTGPTSNEESTGATGPTSMNSPLYSMNVEPIPDIINIEDILADVDVLTKKETDDRILLESIGNITTFQLRPKLIEWALQGFVSPYKVYDITIQPPPVCVDGVSRELREYIPYLTNKNLDDYLEFIRPKFVGMNIDFAYLGTKIAILISKP